VNKVLCVVVAAAAGLASVAIAVGAKPPAKTFVAVLTSKQEVPHCNAATNAARGLFVAKVTNEATGTVRWKLVANNLPGDIIAAHIHLGPKGVAGPVVQPTPPTPGKENGVVGRGSFTNPGLVAAIRANPGNYYVNVHTDVCAAGVIRGQLSDHGPAKRGH
jgi:CHRD domain-containing protein